MPKATPTKPKKGKRKPKEEKPSLFKVGTPQRTAQDAKKNRLDDLMISIKRQNRSGR